MNQPTAPPIYRYNAQFPHGYIMLEAKNIGDALYKIEIEIQGIASLDILEIWNTEFEEYQPAHTPLKGN